MVTITKPLAVKGDFVLLPRKEYEVLVRSHDDEPDELTPIQKRALARSRKAYKAGTLLSLDEFTKKMEHLRT